MAPFLTSLLKTRAARAGMALFTAAFIDTPVSSTAVDLHFKIVPQFHRHPLQLDAATNQTAAGDVISVTRLDFLISRFSLRSGDGSWMEQEDWFANMNLREGRMDFLLKNVPAGSYDRIRFQLGVPAEINHSNPNQYPSDHSLNPNRNGLHWGWKGGYVFLALEGRWSDVSGRAGGYSYHLGNDEHLMSVECPVAFHAYSNETFELNFDLEALFPRSLKENNSTHSRTGDSMASELRKQIEGSFRCVAAAGVFDPSKEEKPRSATLSGNAHPYPFTFSSKFPIPDLPRDNPLTLEGVELGRALFFEKLLSGNQTQSCASCHRPEAAFTDAPRSFSRGAEGGSGSRNAMPLFNLAWKQNFFWDGRARSLREQVLMPIQNPAEMNGTISNAVMQLTATAAYPVLFQKAFGDSTISGDRIACALEQFLLTLISDDSKLDRAAQGRASLDPTEQRGFELFMTEYDPRRGQFGADCFHCHGGALFSSQTFANNGLDVRPADAGRAAVSQSKSDLGRFAVPSLRNVALTAPYMHDGRFATLEEVVRHYCSEVKISASLDPNLAKHPAGGLHLGAEDQNALVAFLKTLTDTRFAPADGKD